MSLLRDIFTTKSNGVPKTYTKLMKVGKRFIVSKGELNKLQVRPNILNEHAESSREVMGSVTSSNIVGQIFKASQDNINGLFLTLQSSPGGVLDNFESYATSAALQAVWVKGGTKEALLETGVVYEGSKSMALPGDILNDSWVDTIASTNYTDYTFSFEWRQNKEYNKLKYEFTLSDGVDTLSFPLVVSSQDTWVHFDVDINAMVDSGTTNVAAITSVGFRVVDKEAAFFGYVDELVATPPPGSVNLKLWDCGSVLPVADGASFDLSTDATQITEIGDWGIDGAVVSERSLELRGGKRVYHIDNFTVGTALEHPNNDVLTVGNYYAITVHHVDTNVDVFGPDTTFSTNYYTNGYAFSTPAEGTDITKISGAAGGGAYSDIMFAVFSTQKIYLVGYHLHFSDASGGNVVTGRESSWFTFVEDENMIMTSIATLHGGHPVLDGVYEEDFSWRPIEMNKGGKFEVYYNDDLTDSVYEIELEYFYLHVPPIVNG
jgi:hypothetical protein